MRPAVRLGGLALLALNTLAQAAPANLADCAQIAADPNRLACFDQLAAPFKGQGRAAAATTPPAPTPAEPPSATPAQVAATTVALAPEPSYLQRHWEIGEANKRGAFQFRMHDSNYIIAKYSTSPNNAPYQPLTGLVGAPPDLSNFELSYQLGFKMKVIEEGLPFKTDLWVAYTQRSFWQADNGRASSPFRETNYTPEVMAVTPLDFNLLGLRARFLNLGLVHQSNGQAGSLSRSWNRVYAQLGLERGGFSLLGRVWQRIGEPAATDDNPNITDYLGHGDLQFAYRENGHEYTLLTRYNARSGRGAAQAAWAFPIAGKLKGYVQVFSGYGQSLIDYNNHENTLGLGLQMNY
jgi:phospholipase A1